MKVLLKAGGVFAVVLMMGLASCVTDSCTECTNVTGANMQTLDTLICIDQFDSRSDYDNQIEVYKALGGTCVEK